MIEPISLNRTDSVVVVLVGRTIHADSKLAGQILKTGLKVEFKKCYQDFQQMSRDGVQVVVVECGDRPEETLTYLREMSMQSLTTKTNATTGVPKQYDIILINGGLDGMHLAKAWQAGIKDYFKSPYDVDLIAERIHFLVKARSVKPHLGQSNPMKSENQD